MATRCDSSGISFQTQCLHGPLSAVSIPDSSGIVYQFQSKLDEICPFVPLKPATEKTPFLCTPHARRMSEKVATNSHETNAEKLRRSSLALRGKRCYHLFLCSVAPTAPAAQPAVSLATVYGCKGCAAGLVFMCVSRASLACCDCYPQRLFGKLGAATAVSGFRAKELDPYHRRCRTVH